MHDVYGIRAVKFNQGMNSVTVEYDASRLTKGDIEFMLRNAAIRPAMRWPELRDEALGRTRYPGIESNHRCCGG